MNYNALDINYLQTHDVVVIAKGLLGKILVSTVDGNLCAGRIVESEAYRAPDDKGSHAFGNKLTNRTQTMFANGGIAYIYLIYGIHNMFNVVTGPEGTAHAVLIRAVEPIEGIEVMQNRRRLDKNIMLTNGPGKLCEAFGISKTLNGINLCDNKSDIFIAEGSGVDKKSIVCGPRVGIAYAEECADWPWRFSIRNNNYVSFPREVIYNH